MKKTTTIIFLAVLAMLFFISCEKKADALSRTLLIEQSKQLSMAYQRELSGLMSKIAEENLNEKRATSKEYNQIFKLYNELEKFDFNLKNANRTKVIKMIIEQNNKFKNDNAFKHKYRQFIPVKPEALKQLDDEVFKFYTLSKISEFYLHSAGTIFVKRKHANRAEL